ncbi:type II toxin-antitoxin system RatA family toxin [Zophobihabitans entericus]|uniref:Type II toxin-antitoxin system RatA family toxin n=1 Tax=Zophobihabitans entericus TaxID=1635327 RepID=A0A6G9IAX7_9GAMM|nr:type II toxin-antitoxin system RatA family toxin [Zophobihabitans entericus]QIQ20987.1 type II toxin-antitoxin system RatA family toxin [Zophobihabitans entericus]
MQQVSYTVTEPFSAQQMYALVNDINAYPEFVPDCKKTGIIQQMGNEMRAYIEVEKLGFKKRFITKNIQVPHSQILMELVEGPFNELKGQWSFTPVTDNSCTIEFNLKFEFKSRLLEAAFSPIFKDIMTNMVKAFSRRAQQVYG